MTAYEIVIKGRAIARFLRPLLRDFAVDHTVEGVSRLIGDVRDVAHLHGIVADLTSVDTEPVSIALFTPSSATSDRPSIHR